MSAKQSEIRVFKTEIPVETSTPETINHPAKGKRAEYREYKFGSLAKLRKQIQDNEFAFESSARIGTSKTGETTVNGYIKGSPFDQEKALVTCVLSSKELNILEGGVFGGEKKKDVFVYYFADPTSDSYVKDINNGKLDNADDFIFINQHLKAHALAIAKSAWPGEAVSYYEDENRLKFDIPKNLPKNFTASKGKYIMKFGGFWFFKDKKTGAINVGPQFAILPVKHLTPEQQAVKDKEDALLAEAIKLKKRSLNNPAPEIAPDELPEIKKPKITKVGTEHACDVAEDDDEPSSTAEN